MDTKHPNTKLNYLFSGIFVLFVGILTILSMFMHCETSLFDYDQTKTVTGHTFYLYLGLALVGITIAVLFCFLLERILTNTEKGTKICKGISFFCGFVILAAGVLWILFNDSVPAYDQKTVYLEAQRIAGFLDEPFDTGYFAYFSRNRGITLLVAFAMKIFGNHLYSFRVINLLAALAIYYSICRTVKLIFKNPVVMSLTSLLLLMFYPLVIYTSYYYGTLLSIAFTSLGLYGTAALCETGKRRYGITIILAFPMGILMHQSAAIGLIAAIIYLFINQKPFLRNVIIAVLTAIVIFLSMKIVDGIYAHITDSDPNTSSVPASCTVYMGLTSVAGASGPGSQDGADARVFTENNCDEKAANKDALNRIFKVVNEYLTGERSLRFFVEKTEYQWLDPTFGGRKTIRMNDTNMGEPANSDAFTAFYNSSLRSVAFKISIAFMLIVYISALISGVRTLRNLREYPIVILLHLYVIGGGAFQLMWESLSRYCLGYFIWLLPLSAFGLWSVYNLFRNRKKSH